MARRRNARPDTARLAILGVGALALTSPTVRHVFGSVFQSIGTDIHGTTGVGVAPGAAPSGGAASSSGIGGDGPYHGDGGQITAAAHAAGIFDASSGASAKYGAALWSLSSHQAQPAFYNLPASDQATWSSVAVRGS